MCQDQMNGSDNCLLRIVNNPLIETLLRKTWNRIPDQLRYGVLHLVLHLFEPVLNRPFELNKTFKKQNFFEFWDHSANFILGIGCFLLDNLRTLGWGFSVVLEFKGAEVEILLGNLSLFEHVDEKFGCAGEESIDHAVDVWVWMAQS